MKIVLGTMNYGPQLDLEGSRMMTEVMHLLQNCACLHRNS